LKLFIDSLSRLLNKLHQILSIIGTEIEVETGTVVITELVEDGEDMVVMMMKNQDLLQEKAVLPLLLQFL
jgi:hypothetical protein